MKPVVNEVPDQFAPHVDAPAHTLRPDRSDLETEHVVEDDLFFENGGEPLNELGFELFR